MLCGGGYGVHDFIGFVIFVVFVFFWSFCIMVIFSVVVFIFFIGIFGGMYFLGYFLDNFSFMVFIVVMGFVVDDVIVVVENISCYVEEGMVFMVVVL